MKRPQYVFRPNLNDPQHRRAWALLQQVPPAKRKEFLVQSIKQILEPICEAKFSNNSYGFRPNRSVEHAISRTYSLLQRAHLHYVLEFDIKGFFDNVNKSSNLSDCFHQIQNGYRYQPCCVLLFHSWQEKDTRYAGSGHDTIFWTV